MGYVFGYQIPGGVGLYLFGQCPYCVVSFVVIRDKQSGRRSFHMCRWRSARCTLCSLLLDVNTLYRSYPAGAGYVSMVGTSNSTRAYWRASNAEVDTGIIDLLFMVSYASLVTWIKNSQCLGSLLLVYLTNQILWIKNIVI